MNIQDLGIGAGGLLLQASTITAETGTAFGMEIVSKMGMVGVKL